MIQADIKKQLKNIVIDARINFKGLKNVLFGSSGSGKTSILKMIAGFFDPDEGYIKVNDALLFDSSKKFSLKVNLRGVGYIPQEYTLFPHLNVYENIVYGIRARKLKVDNKNLNELINLFGISDYLTYKPEELSGGQKQRIAVLRAFVAQPKLLLLDEPFSALDRPVREQLRELVEEVIERFEIPSIFVSHDFEEAYLFADEIAVIENGRIIKTKEKYEMFNKPCCVSVARLFGVKNIFKIKQKEGDLVKIGNIWIEGAKGRGDYLCIKASDVMVLREDVDVSDKENRFYGVVKSVEDRGFYVAIKVAIDGLEIYVDVLPHVVYKMDIKKGKRILISLKKEGLVVCN